MNDELKLLVEWSSPWEEFITAIRPALGRSAAPLAAETHSGLFPYRGMTGGSGGGSHFGDGPHIASVETSHYARVPASSTASIRRNLFFRGRTAKD